MCIFVELLLKSVAFYFVSFRRAIKSSHFCIFCDQNGVYSRFLSKIWVNALYPFL